MMNHKNRRPSYWKLWLLFPIMLGLLLMEHQITFSSMGHHIAQVTIVLLVYGLMFYWLKDDNV
jgi:uncharacterized membrane protein YhaH (DUF805 family)